MLDRMEFEHKGRTFRCRVKSAGVSASGPARVSHAWWVIEVDGRSTRAFPADVSDAEADVRRRVIEWDGGRFSSAKLARKIEEYHVVPFASLAEAMTVANGIMRFVGSTKGIGRMRDPKRAVIWSTSTLSTDATLYLSPGAINAALAAGIVLQKPAVISASGLPAARALLLGDNSDWHFG